jgi:hypothetical protein
MTPTTTSRVLSVIAAGALVLSLAACGDDETASGSPIEPTDGSTVPETLPPPAADVIEHPDGADDVVLRIAYEGGFVPVEVAWLNLPTLIVTGDGRLVVQGPTPAIYPGPLLPNMQVRTISEAGIQELLALAEEHGLLAERDYEAPTNVADAPDTVVVVRAAGGEFRHQAYALGIGGLDGSNETGPRADLQAFVEEVTGDWLHGQNPELGTEQAYAPDTYLARATVVTDLTGFEIEPTVLEWTGSVDLAAAVDGCVELPAAEYRDVLEAANQLTFFSVGETTYSLAVKPLLPGDGC